MSDASSPNTADASGETRRAVVAGRKYAASSMKSQATEAAMRILEAGGNAFDAAVAGQAVLALVDPSMNSYGSDAVALIYDAKTKAVASINAEGTAPQLATIAWYRQYQDNRIPVNDGLLSGTVPGVVDAWYILLDRWGTMTFAQVLQPAIEIAEVGFALPHELAEEMASLALRRYPSSVKLYQPAGRPYHEGDIFKNPDAAAFLHMLLDAERGAASDGRHAGLLAARDRFYKGDIARTMAAFAEAQGALFRYDDFARYSAVVETPVSVNYRGYDIYKNPCASQGPAELFALTMLEDFDLAGLGLNSPDYIHLCAEAVKLAMADREKFLGDADVMPIPYEGLLSKDYAAARRALIDSDHASFELRPGDPSAFMTGSEAFDYPWHVTMEGDASHEGDTSYLCVVDADRNMVSFMPSIHSEWGTKVVIPGLGFILNCRCDYFTLEPGEANALAPGKRPRSTLQSTLVMKDDQPFMILGSPGGDDQIMRTLQTLLNVIDFGLDVQQAIEAPRWSTQSFPSSTFPHTMRPGTLEVESRIPESVQAALAAKGHRVTVASAWSLAKLAAIMIDPRTGELHAAADPRADTRADAK